MKNLKLYRESIKEAIACTSALVMLSMTSCGTKIERNYKINKKETTTTTTTAPITEKIDVVEEKRDGQTDALYISIELMREDLIIESMSEEQLNALFAIANIDYFLNDSRNFTVFKRLYGEDFDLEENYVMAYKAVRDLYAEDIDFDYSNLYIDSKEDKIITQGVMRAINDLDSGDETKISDGAQFLLDFSKYSDLATVNAYNPDTEEELQFDKNYLSSGGTQIVNWITLFAMRKYNTAIENPMIIENTIELVDGNNEISDIKSEIFEMYDEHNIENEKVKSKK